MPSTVTAEVVVVRGEDFTAVKLGDVVEMSPAEQKNITRWLIKLGIFCPGPRICGQRSAGR